MMKAPSIATFKFFLTTSFVWFLGNVSGQNYTPAQERSAYDYFDRVGDKSFYQQQKIELMKDEMNDYSQRLHTLQEKFNQRFFGVGSSQDYQTPFFPRESRLPSVPKIKVQNEEPVSPSEVYRRRRPSYLESNDYPKLAFEVNAPSLDNPPQDLPPETPGPDLSSSAENEIQDQPKAARMKDTGVYLILRPGVTFPYRGKTSHYSDNNWKHREYEPGFAVTFSGGYQWKSLKFGLGGMYRENKHHRTKSRISSGGNTYNLVSGSASSTIACFLEFGYEHKFNTLFGVFADLNFGYGVSLIEDFSDQLGASWFNQKRTEDTIFAGGGLGVGFHPNEHLSFLLGYRFLYEDEVPAHALEIGINGLF